MYIKKRRSKPSMVFKVCEIRPKISKCAARAGEPEPQSVMKAAQRLDFFW